MKTSLIITLGVNHPAVDVLMAHARRQTSASVILVIIGIQKLRNVYQFVMEAASMENASNQKNVNVKMVTNIIPTSAYVFRTAMHHACMERASKRISANVTLDIILRTGHKVFVSHFVKCPVKMRNALNQMFVNVTMDTQLLMIISRMNATVDCIVQRLMGCATV